MKKQSIIFCLSLSLFCTFFSPLSAQEKINRWTFTAKPDLPNVLLIGDSISIGYTPFVREQLKNEANVYRPMNGQNTAPVNCASTYLTIANKRIDKILTERTWSVIHFNWGLWEIVCCQPPSQRTEGKRDKINGDVSVTLDEYEKNLEILVEQMKKTGAVLIWASTTAVPDEEPSRRYGDEARYNAVAEKVMKKHGVLIDDLHTLSKTFEPKLFSEPKNVHYSDAGYQLLGKQVADSIRAVLKDK